MLAEMEGKIADLEKAMKDELMKIKDTTAEELTILDEKYAAKREALEGKKASIEESYKEDVKEIEDNEDRHLHATTYKYEGKIADVRKAYDVQLQNFQARRQLRKRDLQRETNMRGWQKKARNIEKTVAARDEFFTMLITYAGNKVIDEMRLLGRAVSIPKDSPHFALPQNIAIQPKADQQASILATGSALLSRIEAGKLSVLDYLDCRHRPLIKFLRERNCHITRINQDEESTDEAVADEDEDDDDATEEEGLV